MGWQHYDNSQPNEMTMLVHVLTFDRSDGYLKRVLHGRGICLLEIHNHLCPADLHCGRGLWVIVTSVYILKKKTHDWYQILWQGKLTVVWEEFCIQFFILAVSYKHYQCFVNWLLSTLELTLVVAYRVRVTAQDLKLMMRMLTCRSYLFSVRTVILHWLPIGLGLTVPPALMITISSRLIDSGGRKQ